jgi:hypothetical protein
MSAEENKALESLAFEEFNKGKAAYMAVIGERCVGSLDSDSLC